MVTQQHSLVQVLDAGPEQGAEEDHLAVMDTHARLVVMRHKIFENPTEDLDEWAKKLRQANFKQQYKRRQETTPFQCLPYKPTPEQQAKLLQDIDARRRQNAMSNARQHSSSQWVDGGAPHTVMPRTSSVAAARQPPPDAETTCSSEDEEDDEQAGDGRSRSRSGRMDAVQTVRRTSRRPQRPRRFADAEMYDDDDPDYAPPDAEPPHGRQPPRDAGVLGVPARADGGRGFPFSAPSIGSHHELFATDGKVRRSTGPGHGDIAMTDDLLPKALPGFGFQGGLGAGAPGNRRSIPGLSQQRGDFDDGYLPHASFMHRDGAFDWGSRRARQSGHGQMNAHNAYAAGAGFGAMHAQRSMPPGAGDVMGIGPLLPHSVFPQHPRSMNAHHQMSMPMMAGHGQQFAHAPTAFPHDAPAAGAPQRMESLPEDSSMPAGLDALLHASAFSGPFHSGRLTSARPGDLTFSEDPYQAGNQERRVGGQAMRGGAGLAGVAGCSAADFNTSASMMQNFPGHQRQLQQMGHHMGLQGGGLGQSLGQRHHADGNGVPDMPARMQAARAQYKGLHGCDPWNGMGGGM